MIISAGGISLNINICGEGRPVILLHGNGESLKIFDRLIPPLSADHRVIAVDSRCHGESEDTDALTYELIARDVSELILKLKLEKPVLYGFSDGGIAGLLIAIKYPELLGELIISGANIFPEGLVPEELNAIRETFNATGDKFYRLMAQEPHIKPAELGNICIPVHILAGENDLILPEHTRLIADSIPNSTLEFIPGEDHESYIIHSSKLFHILKKYL